MSLRISDMGFRISEYNGTLIKLIGLIYTDLLKNFA